MGVLFILREPLDCFFTFSASRPFCPDNVETDLLAFIQRFESAGLNGAEVNKDVATALLLDEAEAFAFVEPLLLYLLT